MFVAVNRITMPEGQGKRLEQAFARSGHMEGVAGCRGFYFLRRQGQEQYLVVTVWEDRAAFEAWRQSEAFRRAHTDTGASAGATSELELYDVLFQVAGR
ncbi:MAG: antibiotic biosynthesis monooxygenase [Clostridia bacterium]|nr:antibiotic biosynthesis monooxygenase [Clostridia bacterium]